MPRVVPLLVLVLVTACGKSEGGGASCGIAAMVGPSALLNQFTIPRKTLSGPPREVPERLPARIAAGPAYSSVIGKNSEADSLLLVGVEGKAPADFVLGFGVLVATSGGAASGIMLFEGPPIEAAPHLGTVTFGPVTAPLLGVEADPGVYDTPTCASFPDSLRK